MRHYTTTYGSELCINGVLYECTGYNGSITSWEKMDFPENDPDDEEPNIRYLTLEEVARELKSLDGRNYKVIFERD